MAEILKMQHYGIREFIERDIWGGIRNVLNIELFSFGSEKEPVVLTAGILLALVMSLLVAKAVLKDFRISITRNMTAEVKPKPLSVFGFIQYFIYINIVLPVLCAAGMNTLVLFTALAALFIGMGVALRELFQDVIRGMYIMVVKSLNLGDVVEIEKRGGRVVQINLGTIRTLTRDEKLVIVPNHKFLSEVVRFNIEELFRLSNILIPLYRFDIHRYDSHNLKHKEK